MNHWVWFLMGWFGSTIVGLILDAVIRSKRKSKYV
jgi:hypothetical protein